MNIPSIFTILRIVLTPCLLAPLIVFQASAYFTFLWYIFLASTDFFDGFFARRYGHVTPFGAFLDQFADKIFLFSVMFALVYTHQCYWWWALLIAVRELLVMGLREYGGQKNIVLPVIYSAKIKTALQMIFFGWLILQPDFSGAYYVTLSLFFVTVAFSYYSAYWYLKKFMGNI